MEEGLGLTLAHHMKHIMKSSDTVDPQRSPTQGFMSGLESMIN